MLTVPIPKAHTNVGARPVTMEMAPTVVSVSNLYLQQSVIQNTVFKKMTVVTNYTEKRVR